MNLAFVTNPGLLVALVPFAVIFLGVITFEVAMGVTISTLPRSRFQQKWTDHERRRVFRVFCVVFSVWPIAGGLLLAHLFTPIWSAVIADLFALAAFIYCIRWLAHGIRQRNLVLAGHCANCYYDLRASKQRKSCPECGIPLHDHPALSRPAPSAKGAGG